MSSTDKDEAVIVFNSRTFAGPEALAREILMAEIIRLYPIDPTESDIALARLQRGVRGHVPDARLSLTTLDELTRTPLSPCEACFLARALSPARRTPISYDAVGGSFA